MGGGSRSFPAQHGSATVTWYLWSFTTLPSKEDLQKCKTHEWNLWKAPKPRLHFILCTHLVACAFVCTQARCKWVFEQGDKWTRTDHFISMSGASFSTWLAFHHTAWDADNQAMGNGGNKLKQRDRKGGIVKKARNLTHLFNCQKLLKWRFYQWQMSLPKTIVSIFGIIWTQL